MKAKCLGPFSLFLSTLVIAFGISLLLAPPAHAQYQTGCAQYLLNVQIPCYEYFADCPGFYPILEPIGNGSAAWYAYTTQFYCCGIPLETWFGNGTCQVAKPQAQPYSPTVDRLRKTLPGRRPTRRTLPAFSARVAMPEYLMGCKGRYIFYLAPASK